MTRLLSAGSFRHCLNPVPHRAMHCGRDDEGSLIALRDFKTFLYFLQGDDKNTGSDCDWPEKHVSGINQSQDNLDYYLPPPPGMMGDFLFYDFSFFLSSLGFSDWLFSLFTHLLPVF